MIVNPTPVPQPGQPLPDPANLNTWPVRMAEMHRWMRETAAPGMNLLAAQTLQNAAKVVEMAMMAAGIANFVGNWSTLTGALNMPASTYHTGKFWVLLENLPDVTAEEPSDESLVWGEYFETVLASQVEITAISGSDATHLQEALEELFSLVVSFATQAENQAGTEDSKSVSPLGIRQALWADDVAGRIFALRERVTCTVHASVSGTYNKAGAPASGSWTVTCTLPDGVQIGDTVYPVITSGGLDTAYGNRNYRIQNIVGSTVTIGPAGNPNIASSGSGNCTLRFISHLRRGHPDTQVHWVSAGKVNVLWGNAMPAGYSVQASNAGADTNAVTWARPVAGLMNTAACQINCVVGTTLTDPSYLSVNAF